MSRRRRKIEWNDFWLREVVCLSIPALIAVFTLPPGETIHAHRLEILLLVLFSLTLGNVLWEIFGASLKNHIRSRQTGHERIVIE